MPHAEMHRCEKIADGRMPFPPGGDGAQVAASLKEQKNCIRARSRRGLAEKCRCASGRIHVVAGGDENTSSRRTKHERHTSKKSRRSAGGPGRTSAPP
jgi:hypothetical protein